MHCWSLFWLLIVLHRDWFETAFISKIPFIKYAYNWLCIRFCFICIVCTPCLRINRINRVLLWYINYFYLYEKKNLNIYYIIWIIIHIDKGTAQLCNQILWMYMTLYYLTRRELFHSFLKIFNVLEKRVHLIKTKIKAKCLFRPFNSFTNYLTSKR